MNQARLTDEQIIGILQEREAGVKCADPCRKHGLADPDVGPEDTHAAIRGPTAAGILREVLFPDEGHGVLRRRDAETCLRQSAQFLDRALRADMRPAG